MFNGLQSALYPRLMRINEPTEEFSYQDTIYTPCISTMGVWLDTINVEEIERRGRELARLTWFRNKMGKFFSKYRLFDSCKEIDKDLNFGRKIRSFETKIKMKKREHQMIVWENVYKMKYLRDIYKSVPYTNIVKYRLHLSGGRVKPKFVSIDIKYIRGLKTYSKNIKAEEFKDLVKLSRKLCGGN